MIDAHFYINIAQLSAAEIARIAGYNIDARFEQKMVNSVAPLEKAGASALAYCEKTGSEAVINSNAGIILLREEDYPKLPKNSIGIICKAPRSIFSQIAPLLIKPLADTLFEIGKAKIEKGAQIAPSATIANSAQIGANSLIAHNAIIGPGVTIGRNCIIEAGAVVNCAYIGDNVRIGANTIIGKAGFGVAAGAKGPIDVPQFGRVIIQDDVTIGALCTIDRAAFGETVIGMGSKIDNHCHIGHNSKLGRGVIIAAFGGISGSVEIGNYVMMGGRVGVGDHFQIGDGAKIAAGSAVLSNVPAGETYAGYPAKPKMRWMKEAIVLSKLAEKPKS